MSDINIYRAEFFACCPVNGIRVKYSLRIDSKETITVERINETIDGLPAVGLHEDLAARLKDALPGLHVLTAHHHGVDIETRRAGAGQ